MHPTPHIVATRAALIELVRRNQMTLDTAVTLTSHLDCDKAEVFSKRITRCLRQLNSRLFHKQFQRKGVAIPVVSVFEGGGYTGKRLHAHLSMQRPAQMSLKAFEDLLGSCWADANGKTAQRITVKEITSDNWTFGYLTKDLRCNNFDNLDLPNFCTGIWPTHKD